MRKIFQLDDGRQARECASADDAFDYLRDSDLRGIATILCFDKGRYAVTAYLAGDSSRLDFCAAINPTRLRGPAAKLGQLPVYTKTLVSEKEA